MRVAVITSSGANLPSGDRRADAMARFLAARGDTVVRLPTTSPRLGLRTRIIPIHMPALAPRGDGLLAQLSQIPGAVPWAMKVAGHLRQSGPFDVVLAADAGLALVAATAFRYRQTTPFAVNLERVPPPWARALMSRANAVLVPDEDMLQQALQLNVPASRLHLCPTPVDPGFSNLRTLRRDARKALGLSHDSFVTLCPQATAEGQGLAAVRDACAALAHHGMFKIMLPYGQLSSRGARVLPEGFDPLQAMAAADAVCLTPADRGASIPGGLIEAMAAGRPILLMADAETPAARLLAEAEAGSRLTPGDSASLQVAIFGLWADPKLAARTGLGGQRWAQRHHSVERSGVLLADVLTGLVGAPPSDGGTDANT